MGKNTDLDYDKIEKATEIKDEFTEDSSSSEEDFEDNIFTVLWRTADARLKEGQTWKDCDDVLTMVILEIENMIHKAIKSRDPLLSPKDPDYEDMYANATKQVIETFQKWNPDKVTNGKRTKFSSYAFKFIMGAVNREDNKKANKLTPHYYAILTEIDKWSSLYEEKNGFKPSVEELSILTNYGIRVIQNAFSERNRVSSENIDDHISTFKVQSAESEYFSKVLSDELIAIIEDRNIMDDKDRLIIYAMVEGYVTYREIALHTGLQESEVKLRRSSIQLKLTQYREKSWSRNNSVRTNRSYSKKLLNKFAQQNEDFALQNF